MYLCSRLYKYKNGMVCRGNSYQMILLNIIPFAKPLCKGPNKSVVIIKYNKFFLRRQYELMPSPKGEGIKTTKRLLSPTTLQTLPTSSQAHQPQPSLQPTSTHPTPPILGSNTCC